MEIRTILVNVDLFGSTSEFIGSAVDLAARHKAALIGFAAAEPATALIGAEGAVVATTWFEQEQARIEEALGNAERTFRSLVPAGTKSSWRSVIANPTRGLIESARCADLVMVSSVAGGETNGPGQVDIGELIVSAGRPVLIGASGASRIVADKIVVAWKDTPEARHAIADSLPFLKGARDVLVAEVDEGDYGAERLSLDDAVAWLTAHGVKVRGDILPMAGTPASTIQAAAVSMGADLVVSGGYGHTRLREWLFGGMTQDLLNTSTINRFLSK